MKCYLFAVPLILLYYYSQSGNGDSLDHNIYGTEYIQVGFTMSSLTIPL